MAILDKYPLPSCSRSRIMLKGTTVVVTGATSGIGRISAVELARQGAHIVFIARNEAKAAATRAAIKAAAPSARVDVHHADFTSLDAVAGVGREIASTYEHVDVLINNADLHAFEQRITAGGFAEMVTVNYLTPWLLTNIILKKLIESAPRPDCHRRLGSITAQRQHEFPPPPIRHHALHALGFVTNIRANQAHEYHVLHGTGTSASRHWGRCQLP
jgi:NAD(P)-dependent dehydrogenase (short-subunit alcohol dehydrogenase family)